jgi:hypothetical protein
VSETVVFAPLLPWPAIAAAAGLGFALLAFAALRRGRGAWLRALVLSVLTLALLNPLAVREEREAQPDVAVVAVDRSASQHVGERRRQTEAALAAVETSLKRFRDLEARIVRVESSAAEDGEEGTRLFGALARALGDIPRQRLAGAVLITDGQVHDVPAASEEAPAAKPPQDSKQEAARRGPFPGPVHVLLTGGRGETDRRLVVEKAPSYGIVGRPVTVSYRVEERGAGRAGSAGRALVKVETRREDGQTSTAHVPLGQSVQFSFPIERAGPTIVELAAEAAAGELSDVNNRAFVSVNGVRDRLRVLLISGQPHAGERTWRNLLKSDPSVDLVHFTILRPPEKDDFTPLRELALISFPVQELFESKLKEFDLIVFDRYVVREILPLSYLRNVTGYVREGGALLFAVGPEFAGMRSLFLTPLGEVIPAKPTGRVIEQGFQPMLTDLGRRHPVTAHLPGDVVVGPGGRPGDERPAWGRWFRQIEGDPRAGVTLMQGLDARPLLLLDRVGKGRIAQVMSDHIWLWARGFEGGGPQAEFLRRLAHWLMKEPDLEEEGLFARVERGKLMVERRSLSEGAASATVTMPSGQTRPVRLEGGGDGVAKAVLPIEESGLYRVGDGKSSVLAVAGALNPLELQDLRATPEHLAPIAEATGGGIGWIKDGIPDVRRVKAGRDTAGRGWIGLVQNESYVVRGVSQVSLLPALLVLLLALGGLMAAWWREGH